MLLAYGSDWSQSPKLCPSFTVMVITQLQRELATCVVILYESYIKQTKQNKRQMQSLNTFLQEVQKQSFLTIKLPFTVGFFVHLQSLRNDGENAQRQIVSKWIFTQCEINCTIGIQRK